ncbi:MAG: polysaccharide biosynthesis/export family protein, partial [Imperialibacter sp.]
MKLVKLGISFSRLQGLFKLASIIFLLIVILAPNDLKSQSFGDLSSIKDDLLTDQQIEDLLIKAETLGVSQDRLIALARQRGMLPAEHAKFEKRVIQVSNVRLRREKRQESSAEALRKTQRFGSDNLFESITGRDSLGYELTSLEKKIFGYSIFHNKPLDFSPNLNMPTPKNYILGPGDEVIINIYGATTDSFKEIITPDGKINMKFIGLINIGGLSVEAAISSLTSKLGNYYSGLRGNNPNTFLSLTLGNVR